MMTAAYTFNDAFLDGKRLLGDTDADQFIERVFRDSGQKELLQHWMKNASGIENLNTLVGKFPDVDFIVQANRLPDWANPRLMQAGSVFFSRHSESIMSLLGLLSLPYCYSAANGAMVLYLSERIRKETTKRLFETAVFVWEVMAPGAFQCNGKAFTEILKVRLMHAAVRYYTLRGGKWDQAWGLPVNQEDMAGTNLSFSLIVVRGLRLLGYSVSNQDQEAFLHLWNVIGYFTGLDQDLIAVTPKMAQQLDGAISKRQFRVSAHGKELTHSLTEHILNVNKSKATAGDILGLMRYLLGRHVAEQLGIEAPELPAYKLRLIQTINFLKSLRPQGDAGRAYHEAYRAFRLQKPA
jgi:hypothetical protein